MSPTPAGGPWRPSTSSSGVGALRTGLTADRARDELWLLISPEAWAALVQRRGWSNDDYEQRLAASVSAALLGTPREG